MSKDIKKALEHCIEWNCVDCPNREELGSGETVCRGRLLPEVLEYVADLEAKLEESEKLTERLQQIVDKLRDKEFAGKTLVEAVNAVYEPLYKNKYDEAEELKQQLAEKDKEIKQLKLDLGMFKSVNEFLNRYGIEKAREVLLQTEKTKNQDKISFAVDILEELAGCSNYINSKLDFECGSYVSEKAIRDKIKYLKGKKDE